MPVPDTFDAFVPSNFADLFATAEIPPYIGLTELRELERNVVNKFQPSYLHAQKLCSKMILDHSLRCYYFALAILQSFPSKTPSIPQISRDELIGRVYLACILHDLGLSSHEEAIAHPTRDMTFEIHGGILAYEHLRAEYAPDLHLNNSQIADVAQSIMLHTISFQTGLSSAAGMLLYVSAFIDVVGYEAAPPNTKERAITYDTVREIEEAFPLDGMTLRFGGQIREMLDAKPNCLVSHSTVNEGSTIGGSVLRWPRAPLGNDWEHPSPAISAVANADPIRDGRPQ
ncbi:hypothetical protein GG344DRAFT_68800 [Lentinula edodes]|nr:hypothetical protein GG344DRAFT_68800 [Lentinula edodes]